MNGKSLEAMYRGWRGVFTGETVTCPKCDGTGRSEWAHDVVGNCTWCYGFGVVEIEHSPASEDLVEVAADVLPDEVAAILALTPHLAEDADWREREEEARRLNELAARELTDSWHIYAEKPVKYEDDGDVIWA